MLFGDKEVFSGAIRGIDDDHLGMILPLEDNVEVFVLADGTYAIDEYIGDDLAGIYYVSSQQEYYVEVMKEKSVYLKSGQPLGKRLYRLPRGSKIYFNSKEYLMELL